MFRRQAKSTFNSHRWFSHRSGPRKSTYALTRGAAVATSVAAVAAATIASQKFIEGSSIHNDASTPNIAAATSGKVSAGTTRVGGTNDGDEEALKLLVWGSNRCVPPTRHISYFHPDALLIAYILPSTANSIQNTGPLAIEDASFLRTSRMRPNSVRRGWPRSCRTWRCATWRCTSHMRLASTDEGTCISGVMGTSPRSLRLRRGIESPF